MSWSNQDSWWCRIEVMVRWLFHIYPIWQSQIKPRRHTLALTHGLTVPRGDSSVRSITTNENHVWAQPRGCHSLFLQLWAQRTSLPSPAPFRNTGMTTITKNDTHICEEEEARGLIGAWNWPKPSALAFIWFPKWILSHTFVYGNRRYNWLEKIPYKRIK